MEFWVWHFTVGIGTAALLIYLISNSKNASILEDTEGVFLVVLVCAFLGFLLTPVLVAALLLVLSGEDLGDDL